MNAAAPHSSPRATVLVWDFSDRTQLVFRGLDRLRYLNGQLTQDLKKLTPIRALPACVTNAKGRLQADVWVSLGEDVLIVDAAPELREILAARLERYIVADDVTLEDCREVAACCIASDSTRRSIPCCGSFRLLSRRD